MEKKKKGIKIPHTYVLILLIIFTVTVLTYIIPSGQYARYTPEGSSTVMIDPSSYQRVDQTPVTPFKMVQAIPQGMTEVGWIIFLVFIIGGAFEIINATGAIEASIGALITKLSGRGKILIPILMVAFSFAGATIGMAESTIIFIPIGISLARALGYDAIVGMAMVNIGAVIGFAGGAMNMFTVGVAQGIAGVPLFSGMEFRIIAQVIFLAGAIFYIMRYAAKVKRDPTSSVIYDLEAAHKQTMEEAKELLEFTGRRKAVMLVMAAGFAVLIYGIITGWSTGTQISSLFLVMGIVAGFVGGMGPNTIAETFIKGAKAMTYGALVIGISRAILVIMTEGQIIDTILHAAGVALGNFPPYVAAGLMLLVQLGINFIINSGSGQAATTMPIMAPLADVVNVPRQTAVLAYQYGDGFSNSLFPTSGVLMASLSIANIPYEKWLKWAGPLMAILYGIATVLVIISTFLF